MMMMLKTLDPASPLLTQHNVHQLLERDVT